MRRTPRLKPIRSKRPSPFIANRGQLDPPVRFHLKGLTHSVLLTREGLILRKDQPSGTESENQPEVRLRFEGANPKTVIQGEDRQPGVVNFYRGKDPKGWQSGVPTFGSVHYLELYQGIDLVIRCTAKGLKSEYRVSPDADPLQILLLYDGVEAITLAEDGSLILRTPLGEMT